MAFYLQIHALASRTMNSKFSILLSAPLRAVLNISSSLYGKHVREFVNTKLKIVFNPKISCEDLCLATIVWGTLAAIIAREDTTHFYCLVIEIIVQSDRRKGLIRVVVVEKMKRP